MTEEDLKIWRLLYVTILGWNMHPKNEYPLTTDQVAFRADIHFRKLKEEEKQRWHTGVL